MYLVFDLIIYTVESHEHDNSICIFHHKADMQGRVGYLIDMMDKHGRNLLVSFLNCNTTSILTAFILYILTSAP